MVPRSSADGTPALSGCFWSFVYVSFRFISKRRKTSNAERMFSNLIFFWKTFNILTSSHYLNHIQTHLSRLFPLLLVTDFLSFFKVSSGLPKACLSSASRPKSFRTQSPVLVYSMSKTTMSMSLPVSESLYAFLITWLHFLIWAENCCVNCSHLTSLITRTNLPTALYTITSAFP